MKTQFLYYNLHNNTNLVECFLQIKKTSLVGESQKWEISDFFRKNLNKSSTS
jgi:hypothetical protein